ncbi:MAG: TrkH family potassium uptake protein [Clostridiales bacterium]|nr:TrkH family potassium uptake protein [Clostridiales bacterium]
MTVHFKSVAKLVGSFMMILAAAMLLPIITGIYYGETHVITSFISVMIPCTIVGFFLYYKIDTSSQRFNTRDGFLAVSLCWILAAAIGALPLTISGAIPNFIEAFFEMSSGFSTTGSTILTDIEKLPKSALFWRSFSHWIGGMGMIVLAMAFLSGSGIKGQHIASAETPGPTLDKLSAKYTTTARSLYMAYLIFTCGETVLLMIGGMSFYDALVHTFGTVGTGGFSTYNDSLAHFDSPFIHWVIIVFMFLCSVNFNIYFIAIRQGLRTIFHDSEFKVHLMIISSAIILIVLNLSLSSNIWGENGTSAVGTLISNNSDKPIHWNSFFKLFTDSAFQAVSIMSTTGYMTSDFDLWPTFSKFILLGLMFVGGSSASTGGGMKVGRIVVMAKLAKRGLYKKNHPNSVYLIKMNGQHLRQEIATNITNFIFFYFLVLAIGTLVISINGFDLITSFSSVLTCLSNVGPGFNLVGPTMNFHIFSGFSKIVLSILMIGGRLELFTLFILLSPHYWNSNKA